MWRRLCMAIDRPDLLEHPLLDSVVHRARELRVGHPARSRAVDAAADPPRDRRALRRPWTTRRRSSDHRRALPVPAPGRPAHVPRHRRPARRTPSDDPDTDSHRHLRGAAHRFRTPTRRSTTTNCYPRWNRPPRDASRQHCPAAFGDTLPPDRRRRLQPRSGVIDQRHHPLDSLGCNSYRHDRGACGWSPRISLKVRPFPCPGVHCLMIHPDER